MFDESSLPLPEILSLDRLTETTFRGYPRTRGLQRTFGGEVAAQSVIAAGHTVPPDRGVHAVQALFLLAGDPARPVDYVVDEVRDGGSFSTRRVEARQGEDIIAHVTTTHHHPEAGFSHQPPPPRLSGPEESLPADDAAEADPEDAEWYRRFRSVFRVELRFPDAPLRSAQHQGVPAPPEQRAWLRAIDPLGDDPIVHAAAMVYFSDLLILSTTLGPHGIVMQDPSLMTATIDHSLWLHAPVRADEWFLYNLQGMWSGAGRGLSLGWIYTPDGSLVATAMQEGLLRQRR